MNTIVFLIIMILLVGAAFGCGDAPEDDFDLMP